jgi:hypothetical protein
MVDQQDEKGWIFDATNGNRRIRITVADCYSNTFVEVSNVNPYVIRFDGYIRTLKDFQLILELTSVKSPF